MKVDHQLITEADTRGIVYRGKRKTGGLENNTVDLLANQFLLRSEIRAGGVWYELSHDRFIGPIKKSNEAWRTARLKKWGGIAAGLAAFIILLLLAITTWQETRVSKFQQVGMAAEEVIVTSTAQVEATSTAAALRARVRPLRPGLSISGLEARGAGTLGYFVVDEADQVYILSAAEVLGRAETEVMGEDGITRTVQADTVLQPGPLDGGNEIEDAVARVAQLLPQEGTVPAANLAGLARLASDVQFETIIPDIGAVRGVREPTVGMIVHKFGRSTGLTSGEIMAVGQDIVESGGDDPDVAQSQVQLQGNIEQLQDTVRASLKASAGDLGALVVDEERFAVGIIVGVSDASVDGTILAPIQAVLDSFEVEPVLPTIEEELPKMIEAISAVENRYIYGMQDQGGEGLMLVDGEARGWVVESQAIGADPEEKRGENYSALARQGFGVIVVLVNDFSPGGTLPLSEECPAFAQRAANFVENSSGARIWVIGDEMNWERNWPRQPGSEEGEKITPRRYADCYKLVRAAIKGVPGHAEDQVIVGGVAPWNADAAYEADPEGKYPANKVPGGPYEYPNDGFWGDWNQYLRDVLRAIGLENTDGVAIHAYTHGPDPDLIFSNQKMAPPFEQYHYNFRTYQDQMEAIPPEFRHLPVYLTAMNQGGPWENANQGWVKNAYHEINNWNQAGHQQIRAAVLYRWSFDEWRIDDKEEVQADFQEAVAMNFTVNPAVVIGTPMPVPTSLRVQEKTPVEIYDVSDSLARSPTAQYPTRPSSGIGRIILHHTATPSNVSVERIANYQVNSRDLPGIAYHYCVTPEGFVYQTQPLTVTTRHAGEENSADSIGVCLIGDFTEKRPPTPQLEATAALLAFVISEFDLSIDQIFGYSEIGATASPGATWPEWKWTLLSKVNFLLTGEVLPTPTPGN